MHATATVTIEDGQVTVSAAVDHCTAECVGIHAVKRATRLEALDPIRQGVNEHFGGFHADGATGLQLRHDHGSQCMSDDLQNEIRSEFEHRQRFADDVRIKLALVKRDVNHLRQKYGRVVTRHIDSADDARSAVSEINRFFLASLYDLQVDLLRLYLALQDDLDFVDPSLKATRWWCGRSGRAFETTALPIIQQAQTLISL